MKSFQLPISKRKNRADIFKKNKENVLNQSSKKLPHLRI